jgi:hypothetical protein
MMSCLKAGRRILFPSSVKVYNVYGRGETFHSSLPANRCLRIHLSSCTRSLRSRMLLAPGQNRSFTSYYHGAQSHGFFCFVLVVLIKNPKLSDLVKSTTDQPDLRNTCGERPRETWLSPVEQLACEDWAACYKSLSSRATLRWRRRRSCRTRPTRKSSTRANGSV